MRNGLPEAKDLAISPVSDLEGNEEYSFHRIADNAHASALAKYQAITVGNQKYLTLLKYEL